MLPPEERLPNLHEPIENQAYFVIHAARQVGKTTCFMDLARRLTESGTYAACVLSCETGSIFPDDPDKAQRAILEEWKFRLPHWLPDFAPKAEEFDRHTTLGGFISSWCEMCPRPVVLFLDEIDALANASLLSVLRQLRAGYASRPRSFPHTLALIGMRDVRDYKVASGPDGRLASPSPFNIMVKSLTIANFTARQVLDLYNQHTELTGQKFSPEASAHAWELTRGQPWLVNALTQQAVSDVPDRGSEITREHMELAKESIIQQRAVHLDNLAERLREPRVKAIFEPMQQPATGTAPVRPAERWLVAGAGGPGEHAQEHRRGLSRRLPDGGHGSQRQWQKHPGGRYSAPGAVSEILPCQGRPRET